MEKSPSSFHKIKPILFVAFLAAIAVVLNRLDYSKQIDSSPIVQSKETAAAINSALFPKREQTKSSEPEGIFSAKSSTESASAAPNQNKFVTVLRVIDGDTIVVNINGQQIHVRLIGVDSPELNDKRTQVACLAQKAKEETEKLLNGQKVYLEKDSTQGDYDKYNRLLAYVFIGDTSFNKLMLEEGYAYEYTYRLPYKYQSEFKAAQNKARSDQKGLWNPDICRN